MNAKSLFKRTYPLQRSRGIMSWGYSCYKRESHTLTDQELSQFEQTLEALDQALLSGDRKEADKYARKVEQFCSKRFRKPLSNSVFEILFALIFALVVATIIRQVWFEPYEIPTGSMRPTYREQDHLIVSKTAMGINIPFLSKQLYFDPDLVQRGRVMIFSGIDLDLPDTSSRYFFIFPYTKRYIKRMIGLPGDTLYFYGGLIYGIDKDGNEITLLRTDPELMQIEHIPFHTFEGRMAMGPTLPAGGIKQLQFRQMNRPIGRHLYQRGGRNRGEIFDGKKWVTDNPRAILEKTNEIDSFSDFWGIRNYGMTRLLNPVDLKLVSALQANDLPEAPLYLEIKHTPHLTVSGAPSSWDEHQHLRPLMNPYFTVIPLNDQHLDRLMDHMYTTRFVIENGLATDYEAGGSRFTSDSPKFDDVPDGVYELYHGKGYSVGFGGTLSALPDDHPLMQRTPWNIQRLYNLGIRFSNEMTPHSSTPHQFPYRYTYFRDGDLYLLGGLAIDKEDPILKTFNESEKKREEAGNYVAFRDWGPPLKNGEIDREFLEIFGLKIPEKQYLFLGDNHAVSLDGRYFGPVPEANIEGAPTFLFWPPGERWGDVSDHGRPWITLPNLLIWSLALVIIFLTWQYYRWKRRQPIYKRIPR